MMIKNQVQLITYPDSMGGNLKTLNYILETYFPGLFRGGIHILPPFPSSGDRGFAPLTYLEIAPEFGTWEDIRGIGEKHAILLDLMVNYVSYLEYALLVQKLYNYSRNLLTSEKKVKKLYLCNTAFTLALNPQIDLSAVLEQFFVNSLGAKFFLKTPQREEIDLIHVQNSRVLPVEIKIREKIGNKDIKTLFKFLEKNNLKRALLITLDTETKFRRDELMVEAIPYWKYWSIRSKISPE